MSDVLSRLLSLLKASEVDFIVVGAHVLAAHGRARFTEDLDIWIRRSKTNAHALRTALAQFGYYCTEQQVEHLVSGRNMLRLGEAPNRVDFLAFLGPVDHEMDFEAAWQDAVFVKIKDVDVRVLSLNDFVRSKRAAGRPKDLSDLALLEEIIGELPE